jgi:uroporphyrinogen decarboxylase
MTRHERVQAAFRGETADRVPIAFWQHFPGRDHEPALLADATAAYQRRFDLDFIKLMPTGMYSVMDYGVTVTPSQDAIGTTRYASGPIREPADWTRLRAAPPERGVLGQQVDVVRRVRTALGPQVPVLQTIFSPLTMAAKVSGGDVAPVIAEHEDLLRHALTRFTDDVVAFGRACLAAGADGFFFATQLATRNALPAGVYERVAVPYDLQVLDALRPGAWGVILHLHGDDPLFHLADRYPIDAVNWHARETAPSLGSGHARTRRGVVGGIARMGPVTAGSVAEVDAEARDAIDQAGGRRLVVAPGCVIPTTAPAENLLALRRAVES